MLTERAEKYLATLKRYAPVPTREVERRLRAQGAPVFEAWVDFHDRYAGYIEPIGHDTAVWGIVHENAYWIDHGRVMLDHDNDDDTWSVVCADLHPSYGYELESNGTFLGSPSESFDIKIERNALKREFLAGPHRRMQEELLDADYIKRVRTEVAKHLDPAASDRYLRYYVTEEYMLKEKVATGEVTAGWIRLTSTGR